MPAVLARFLVVVTVIAFIGGTTMQAMPSAQTLNPAGKFAGSQASRPDSRMAMTHRDQGIPLPMPCKGLIPDCVKQMGCLGTAVLTSCPDTPVAAAMFDVVAYWRAAWFRSGRFVEPELSPPIDL
jgi:hypothetical protein